MRYVISPALLHGAALHITQVAAGPAIGALGDGVVLSSINGRSETRTYAKIVRGGCGIQPLSPEEEHAVRAARLGQDTHAMLA